MAANSRTLIYGGLVVAVVASAIFLSGGDAASKSTAKKPTAKASSKTTESGFTAEDYKARFAPVTTVARNVFRPLIARSDVRGLNGVTGPTGVPTELTMGEQNWVYTGMAEVDSVPTALVENTATQDGVFLKHGERWKQATVYQITPDQLTLVGPDGLHHYIKVFGTEEPAETMPAGVRPLAISPPTGLAAGAQPTTQPGLQGPIGIVPTPASPVGQPARRGNRTQGDTNVRNNN